MQSGEVLTEDIWDRYAFMFEDCGFEIYEGMATTYSTKEIYKEIGAPSKQRLEVREILDSLLTRYYKLEEAAQNLTDDQKAALFSGWIGMLEKITGPLRRQGVDELLGAIPEVPWSWIQKTDSQLKAQGASKDILEERRAGVKTEAERRTQ